MQTPGKRLAGTVPREEPVAKKPFAGRSALINGLIDAHKDESPMPFVATPLSNNVQFVPESRESAQIMESKMIFETILDIVSARNNIANYKDELLRQTVSIAVKRASVQGPSQAQVAFIGQTGGPANTRDALIMAMAEMGIDGRIIAEKEGDGKALFTVECKGDINRVPINNRVMESGNPVDGVKRILSFLAIGQTDDERREQGIQARRASRPPPTPLGIGSDELDGRMVTFDGKLEHGKEGQWIFTYVAKGMETSFSFGSEVTGEDLLDMIDEKIDMLHRQYEQPYPANVLEWRSRGRADRNYMDGIPRDSIGIACTLDYLATCPARMRALIPQEYLDGFDALKKLPPPYPAFLRGQELDALNAALDSLDHPINTIIRETFGGEGSMLDARTQEEVRSLLQLAPTVAVDLCDTAISSVSEAHSLISGDNWSALSNPADLKRNYFSMVFTVRKAISDAISDGTLEIDS